MTKVKPLELITGKYIVDIHDYIGDSLEDYFDDNGFGFADDEAERNYEKAAYEFQLVGDAVDWDDESDTGMLDYFFDKLWQAKKAYQVSVIKIFIEATFKEL